MSERFNQTLWGIAPSLRSYLDSLPSTVKGNVQEIRLRKGLPLTVTVAGESVFINRRGQTCFNIQNDLVIVDKEELEESFRLLCNNSVFAHGEELKNGYIKTKSGNRVGVFGTLNSDGIMSDISGLNIRIAREIYGVALKTAPLFRGGGWLFAGPPGCGKTTILRDFVRQISGGICGKIYRVAVIDSRGELSAGGKNDLGPATDVINIEDKAKGLEIAVRTMFPEVVAFDEIGTLDELNRVKESFNAGVGVVTTAHIGCKEELLKRNVTRSLLESGVIEYVVLLPKIPGGESRIYKTEELLNVVV